MSGISIKINGDNRDAIQKIKEVEGKIKEMKALEKLNNPARYNKAFGGTQKLSAGSKGTNLFGKGSEAFTRALEAGTGQLGKFGGVLGRFIGVGAPYLAAIGGIIVTAKMVQKTLKDMAEKGKNAFNDFERNRAVLNTQLQVFAPGVDTSEIVKGFQIMAENGVNSVDELASAFSKVLPVFGNNVEAAKDFVKMAADMQAATGISADALGELAERVLESGEATKKDVDVLAKRGIPIYKELAEVMGVGSDEIREAVKKNGVSSSQFIAALYKVGDAYKDTASALSNTVEGSKASMEAAKGRAYQGAAEGYGEVWKQYYQERQAEFDRMAIDPETQAAMRKSGESLAKMEVLMQKISDKVLQEKESMAATGAEHIEGAMNAFDMAVEDMKFTVKSLKDVGTPEGLIQRAILSPFVALKTMRGFLFPKGAQYDKVQRDSINKKYERASTPEKDPYFERDLRIDELISAIKNGDGDNKAELMEKLVNEITDGLSELTSDDNMVKYAQMYDKALEFVGNNVDDPQAFHNALLAAFKEYFPTYQVNMAKLQGLADSAAGPGYAVDSVFHEIAAFSDELFLTKQDYQDKLKEIFGTMDMEVIKGMIQAEKILADSRTKSEEIAKRAAEQENALAKEKEHNRMIADRINAKKLTNNLAEGRIEPTGLDVFPTTSVSEAVVDEDFFLTPVQAKDLDEESLRKFYQNWTSPLEDLIFQAETLSEINPDQYSKLSAETLRKQRESALREYYQDMVSSYETLLDRFVSELGEDPEYFDNVSDGMVRDKIYKTLSGGKLRKYLGDDYSYDDIKAREAHLMTKSVHGMLTNAEADELQDIQDALGDIDAGRAAIADYLKRQKEKYDALEDFIDSENGSDTYNKIKGYKKNLEKEFGAKREDITDPKRAAQFDDLMGKFVMKMMADAKADYESARYDYEQENEKKYESGLELEGLKDVIVDAYQVRKDNEGRKDVIDKLQKSIEVQEGIKDACDKFGITAQ